MSGIVYWIWFAQAHVSAKGSAILLEHFDGPKEIFFASESELKALKLGEGDMQALGNKDLAEAERIIRRCGEEDVSILTIQDAAYPERLRNIPDPPAVLYVKGHLPAVDSEAAIAVVGTRKCSPYGAKLARNMGYEIASKGGLVVTGLAEGVDSRAAEGALMAGGQVIGVLGTAINVVFPPFNGRLFADVAARGALISEYPPDAHGNKMYFPMRNRIIAGLSLAVVVPEAPVRSGALITAHRALDYGRDVFAVPGNVDSAAARGSNNLLREGAMFAENGWDVLREYQERFPDKINSSGKGSVPEEMHTPENAPKPEKEGKEDKTKPKNFFKLRVPVKRASRNSSEVLSAQLSGLTENQLKIVGAMNTPSMHVDAIIDICSLPASTVLSEMTMLQIKGFVSQEPGKRFTLNIKK